MTHGIRCFSTGIALLGALALAGCGGGKASHRSVAAPTLTPAMNDNQAAGAEQATQDLVEVARGAGSFTTLLAALEAAELTGALQGEGPFTVFAPTDAAFAKLPEGTVEALLKDKDRLKAILTYHVVAGKVMAADVAGLDSATTLLGVPVAIDTSNGVKVGAATVMSADVLASNGVIHVIDTVLIPE